MGGATSGEVGDCMVDEWKEAVVLAGMCAVRFHITIPLFPVGCEERRPTSPVSNRYSDILVKSTMTNKPWVLYTVVLVVTFNHCAHIYASFTRTIPFSASFLRSLFFYTNGLG